MKSSITATPAHAADAAALEAAFFELVVEPGAVVDPDRARSSPSSAAAD